MVVESSMEMSSALESGSFEDYERDLDALLRHRNKAFADMQRSGSAPPTVEGSISALGSLFGNTDAGKGGAFSTDEDITSHPDYLSYYYSSGKRNPRLPPPALSKEDWRAAQRVRAGVMPSYGGIGDRTEKGMGDGSSNSLFSLQPGASMFEGDGKLPGFSAQGGSARPAEWVAWGGDGLTGLTDFGLGARGKGFTGSLQEKLGQSTFRAGHPPCPASHNNAFDSALDGVEVSDEQLALLHKGLGTVDGVHSGVSSPGLARVQSFGSSMNHSIPSAQGSSCVRNATPDSLLTRRSPRPRLLHVVEETNLPSLDATSCLDNHGDIAFALTGLSLSETRSINEGNTAHQEVANMVDFKFNVPNDHGHSLQQCNLSRPEVELSNTSIPIMAQETLSKQNGVPTGHNISQFYPNGHSHFPEQSSPGGLYSKIPPAGPGLEGSGSLSHLRELSNIGFGRGNMYSFSGNQMPEMIDNRVLDRGAIYGGDMEGLYLNRSHSQAGSAFQVPLVDPLDAQFLQRPDLFSQTASSFNHPALRRNFLDASDLDIRSFENAYLGSFLAQQKLQYGTPFSGKSFGLNYGHHNNAALGLHFPYPVNSLRQREHLSRLASVTRNPTGGSARFWTSENGAKEAGFASSLLEEFKSNKTISLDLSDIVNHVVEFSGDQYGSRFIQQKLETASVEEKNKIFPEIFPHARTLITDVFGNYVIQKFFEHGTENQRRQLATLLTGHVLPLSLQMYGCRVIQKALEVVDLDQKTQMVSELEGSVMKCVRDQNGNHVIQKCIECVPQEKIQFIISSFYGQVVTLSTHPYGCRAIQRVLEHCDDAQTQSKMMEEILQSVSTLAQDQYGNYVVQHVLQHGKQVERSTIISKLAGQIVTMSQQKYASNVVEKCLAFGTPEERQLLINEMLGSTDENEPLQAMMKDQFANYVVQKVLETCDDKNRELILTRIKIHLSALKRYTYGKHIVARVEKLVTAGERHLGVKSCSS